MQNNNNNNWISCNLHNLNNYYFSLFMNPIFFLCGMLESTYSVSVTNTISSENINAAKCITKTIFLSLIMSLLVTVSLVCTQFLSILSYLLFLRWRPDGPGSPEGPALLSPRKQKEIPVKLYLNLSKKISMEGGAWKAGGVIAYVSLHPLPEEGKT